MTPNEKRARITSWLIALGSGAGVIEKTNAAGAIAELLVPDPDPVGPSPVCDVPKVCAGLHAEIADLTSAVEYRDRRIAELTHERNELDLALAAIRGAVAGVRS